MPDLAAAMWQILPGIINRHEGSNRVMEWYLRNYYQKSAFRKGVFCYVRLSGGAFLSRIAVTLTLTVQVGGLMLCF